MDVNYLDLSHEYYILVPKSKDYADELYRYDIYEKGEIKPCFKKIVFDEKKYYYLEDRLFDFINVKCDLLINMYEEEIVEPDLLQIVHDLTKSLINNSDEEEFLTFAKQFLALVQFAIEKKVPMGFYF